MSETALKLLEQIRALPEEDQAWIAEQLAPELPDLTDDPEFFAEIQHRLNEADAHPERSQAVDDVLAEGRRRIIARRQSS